MRVVMGTTAVWLTVNSFLWAQAPVTAPERVEQRIERRENAVPAVWVTLSDGENIAAPSTNVQAPSAGSGVGPTVRTPGADIQFGADAGPARSDPPVQRDDWRYRRHNGQWWYWLPNKTWVTWSGRAWIPYRSSADPNRYASGYRGTEPTNANNNAGGYDPALDSYNTYRRRGLSRNRPRANPPAPPASTVTPSVQGSAIQGGGGQATGGPIGSPQEAGSIRIGAGSSSQSSGARARGNLGTFGTAGGQVGGSGRSADSVEKEPIRVRP